MLVLAMMAAALAGPTDYRLMAVGGLGGGAGTVSPFGDGASGVGYSAGRLLFLRDHWGFELAAREGLASADARDIGGLYAGARFPLGDTWHLRAGFAHHHEVQLSLAEEHPFEASLGSLPGIRHRTGGELGVGFILPFQERMLADRPGVGMDLSLVAFPDHNGPLVYGFMDASVSIGLGRRRSPAAGG